jgi:hypothetical protein
MFPVAFSIWFVGAMMRLAAWPFRAATRRRDPRTVVTIRIRDAEKPADPEGPTGNG